MAYSQSENGQHGKMSSSIATRQKKDCCGCNACAEICPKRCITMIADAKGFHYPKVDTTACIDCGLCKKTCPFEEGNIELNMPLTAYAAWNRDREQHLASSSGGAAYVFSSHIIKQGGVVYGCTSEGMHIRHIRVESLSELPKLQGSKYVQSDIRGLFGQVKSDLKANKPVLFIGTPCQVAGLKNYIKQIPEHLYLVDLICHGVPSQQMLHEHIGRIAKKSLVEYIAFRKGNTYKLELRGKDFCYKSIHYWEDAYLRAFMDGFSCRESCYRCPFAKAERCGDMTIGDFWGLRNMKELLPEAKEGVSVLLPCTDKGLQLVEAIKDRLVIYNRDMDEAVEGNSQLRHPISASYRSKFFRLLYPTIPFDTAVMMTVLDRKANSLLKLVWKCVKDRVGK